jgi:hypothetical protein
MLFELYVFKEFLPGVLKPRLFFMPIEGMSVFVLFVF